MSMQTEYEFLLPKGYVDQEGNIHREGTMRLANAADEIVPLRDPRVADNPAYLPILILARVITRLGTLPEIKAQTIERMFTADLGYLQDFYARINQADEPVYTGKCPSCGKEVRIPVSAGGIGFLASVNESMQNGESHRNERLFLSPSVANVRLRETIKFTCTSTDGRPYESDLLWSVSEEDGGGVIESDGTYYAPKKPGVYVVSVCSKRNPAMRAEAYVVCRE